MWRRSCCKRLQQQGMAALKWRLASQMNNLHNCSFMAHVATYLQHLLTFSGCEYNSQFQWHVFNVTFFYIFFEYEKLPLKKKNTEVVSNHCYIWRAVSPFIRSRYPSSPLTRPTFSSDCSCLEGGKEITNVVKD